jgi:hypothetical protein
MSEAIIFYPLDGESLEISDPSIMREVEFSELPVGTHFYWGGSSEEEFIKTDDLNGGNACRISNGDICPWYDDEIVKVYD